MTQKLIQTRFLCFLGPLINVCCLFTIAWRFSASVSGFPFKVIRNNGAVSNRLCMRSTAANDQMAAGNNGIKAKRQLRENRIGDGTNRIGTTSPFLCQPKRLCYLAEWLHSSSCRLQYLMQSPRSVLSAFLIRRSRSRTCLSLFMHRSVARANLFSLFFRK